MILILVFTKEIDEPIDLLYYACISALGFAFIENLIYLRELSGSIIIGRALASAVGHMAFTSFAVYGIVLFKFKQDNKQVSTILWFFILGSFLHGFFDFLLMEGFVIFFLIFLVIVVQNWAILINNSINNSKYFDYSVEYRYNKVKTRLALSMALLVFFSFLLNGLMHGVTTAIGEYVYTITWGGLLIVFYVSSISGFDLVKGYWRPMRFTFSRPSSEAMPGMRGLSTFREFFTENIIVPTNYVGKNIVLHCPQHNRELSEVFHISNGVIKDRIVLKKENNVLDADWFLVQLHSNLDINNEYENNKILIKLNDKGSSLVHDTHIECTLRLIPTGHHLGSVTLMSSYPWFGAIGINGEDYRH